MADISFTGEFGGLLAVAFGSGCAAGYGFHSTVIGQKVERLFEEKTKMLKEMFDQRVSSATAENTQLKAMLEKAQKHFDDCDERLTTLSIEVAGLKARETRRDP